MGRGRETARFWAHCRRTVEELELPEPFDVEAFIASLARERGRPIDLVPVTAEPNLPCGIVVTTDRADWIVYRADTTAVHRQHILLHEAAHLVCGHFEGGAAAFGAGAGAGDGVGSGATAAAVASLMPHLSPDLIRSVLGRTVYSEPDEREAELVASLILQRAQRRRRHCARTERGCSPLDAVFGIF